LNAQIILASASSRRRELLDQAGIVYQTRTADIDESARHDEAPGQYVERIAGEKAKWVAARDFSGLPILGADTAVVLEGEILGKPRDVSHAVELLNSLSGKTHKVYTAVALVTPGRPICGRLSVSRVSFAELEPEWIRAYCDTGEPMDKAGAYAIQGLAAGYISRLEGSYSGVMGLPLFETVELISSAGIKVFPGIRV